MLDLVRMVPGNLEVDTVVPGACIKKRGDHSRPTMIRFVLSVKNAPRREHLVGRFVIVKCQAELLEIVLRLRAPGRFTSLLNRRQQQGDDDHNQPDDDDWSVPL